jgi:Protein of unknown function (DUF2599)
MTNQTSTPTTGRIVSALLMAVLSSLGLLAITSRPAAADLPPTAYDSYTACNSAYVTGVGVATKDRTISIFPNWAALGSAVGTWNAAKNCSAAIRNASQAVRDSLYAQLACHVQYSAGLSLGGRVWDLETFRPATWNQWTWVRTKCNW